MTETEENEALTALLALARPPYDCSACFRLSSAEVLALARGIVARQPDVTPTKLVELAGACGVPRSVLIRVGKGGSAAAPVREKPTAWSRRTRLASNC